MTLTVVVCTFDRPELIGRVVAALAAQTRRDELEVLVVDDGSSVPVRTLLPDHDWLRVVTHDRNRGLAAARNTALREAAGDWVAFTDDDCVPDPRWAEELCDLAGDHPDAFAVGGPVEALSSSGLVNGYLAANNPLTPLELSLFARRGLPHRLLEYLRRSAKTTAADGARSVASLPGANMAVHRVRCLELGGWDPDFVFGGEEEELFGRARDSGYEIRLGPGPVVRHDFEGSLGDLARRSFLYGRGNERLQAKHGGSPTLYPVPVVTLGLLATAVLRGRARWLVAALLVPPAVFSAWPRRWWRTREPHLLAYPYLQLLQETASDLGWLEARLRRLRRRISERSLG